MDRIDNVAHHRNIHLYTVLVYIHGLCFLHYHLIKLFWHLYQHNHLNKLINFYVQTHWGSGKATYKLWNAGNDGAGSGLDADTLDGAGSGSFLRSDANDTMNNTLTFASTAGLDTATNDVYASMRVIRNNKSGSDGMYIGYLNNNSGFTRIKCSGR